MTWKDNLQEASFKGLKFYVTSHSFSAGRRLISHEFPYHDEPYLEDMGRKSREYRVEGFLLDYSGYFTTRDRIIDAVETKGPGWLMHPYLGQLKVKCESIDIRESIQGGGYVSLSFVFKEDVNNGIAKDIPNKKVIVKNANLKTLSDVEKFYKDAYELLDKASEKRKEYTEIVNQAVNDINKAEKLASDVADVVNDVSRFIKEVSSAMDKIIDSPDLIMSFFESAFNGLSYAVDKSASNLDFRRSSALFSLFAPYSTSSASLSSYNAASSNANNTAEKDKKRIDVWMSISDNDAKINNKYKHLIGLTLKSMATTYLVNAAVTSAYSSSEDSQSVLNNILRICDDIMEDPITSDDLYSSFLSLQNATHEYMVSIQNELPIIKEYEIKKDTNLLSFLYENFGNLDLENEVLRRNDIADLFELKCGSVLKVAS